MIVGRKYIARGRPRNEKKKNAGSIIRDLRSNSLAS
jgi:hypothetical protein